MTKSLIISVVATFAPTKCRLADQQARRVANKTLKQICPGPTLRNRFGIKYLSRSQTFLSKKSKYKVVYSTAHL